MKTAARKKHKRPIDGVLAEMEGWSSDSLHSHWRIATCISPLIMHTLD